MSLDTWTAMDQTLVRGSMLDTPGHVADKR